MTIHDVFQQFGIPVAPAKHEHVRSGWVQVDCPDCSPASRHWRLGFNLRGRYFSCWACGWRPLVPTLAALAGVSRRQAAELLGDVPAGLPGPQRAARGKLVLPPGVGELLPAHREYLLGRGFDPDHLVKVWGIGGIGLAHRLAWRVFVPFHHQGEVVSWLTRSIGPDPGQRHRSASPEEEALDHKELLYGEDHCRHAVVVVEGYTDAWAVGPGAAATCGTSYRRAQVLRIARFPLRVVAFDSERPAQERARKLCRELAVLPGETLNFQFSVKDAAEAMVRCPEEVAYLRREILETA